MPYPLFPDASFPPSRNAPCYCGSGERFKRCCGNQSSDRRVPHGIHVVENFLSPARCAEIIALADAAQGRPFTKPDGTGGRMPDPQRATEWVDFRTSHQQVLDELIATAFADVIIPAEGEAIAWYEEPQLLRYVSGGFYMHHADAWQLVPEQRAWRKVVDRDISVLIYLNDQFEGGELEFKRLFYRLKPRAGMLVWFPSDVRYEHMALPVVSGSRSVIVSWAALQARERVQQQMANRAITWADRHKHIRPGASD